MRANDFSLTPASGYFMQPIASEVPGTSGRHNISTVTTAFVAVRTAPENNQSNGEADAPARQPRWLASGSQELRKKWAGAVVEYLKQVGVHDAGIDNYQAAHPELDRTQAQRQFTRGIEQALRFPACVVPDPEDRDWLADDRGHQPLLYAFLQKYGVLDAAGKKLAPAQAALMTNPAIHEFIAIRYRELYPDLTPQQAVAHVQERKGRTAFWSDFIQQVDEPARETLQGECHRAADAAGQQTGISDTAGQHTGISDAPRPIAA